MVHGNVIDGFKELLNDYILNALAEVDHGYVYLFTLFLSGLVGMLEKSGGMSGFTKDVQQFARTPRSGQFACFGIGIFVFFDVSFVMILFDLLLEKPPSDCCSSRLVENFSALTTHK